MDSTTHVHLHWPLWKKMNFWFVLFLFLKDLIKNCLNFIVNAIYHLKVTNESTVSAKDFFIIYIFLNGLTYLNLQKQEWIQLSEWGFLQKLLSGLNTYTALKEATIHTVLSNNIPTKEEDTEDLNTYTFCNFIFTFISNNKEITRHRKYLFYTVMRGTGVKSCPQNWKYCLKCKFQYLGNKKSNFTIN